MRRTTKAHRGPPIDMDPAWPRSLSPLFSVTTTMTFAHETLSSQGFAESLADIIMVQAPLKSHCYKNSLSLHPLQQSDQNTKAMPRPALMSSSGTLAFHDARQYHLTNISSTALRCQSLLPLRVEEAWPCRTILWI